MEIQENWPQDKRRIPADSTAIVNPERVRLDPIVTIADVKAYCLWKQSVELQLLLQ